MAVPVLGVLSFVLAAAFAVLFALALVSLVRAARQGPSAPVAVAQAIQGGLDAALLVGRIVVDEAGHLLGECAEASAETVRLKNSAGLAEASARSIRYESDRLVAPVDLAWRPVVP